MSKIIIVLFNTLLLTACTWGDSFAPRGIPEKLKTSYIQKWQKQDNVGHTNSQQRWKDFQECGVKNYNNGNLDLNIAYNNMSFANMQNRNLKIVDCMKNKGYITIRDWECVNEKQTQLNGKCN